MASTQFTFTQSAGTNAKKFTVSMWWKPGAVDTNQGLWGCGTGTSDAVSIHYQSGGQLSLETYDGSANPKLRTTRVLRDPAAWYHLVFSIDTTDSSASERLKIWINGVEETDFITDTTITQDSDIPGWSAASDVMKIGNRILDGDAFFDGEMAHVHVIDGTIYAASAFGETDSTSGIWIAKTSPSVTYGTNGGFYKFVSGALTTDSSGESNTLTQVGSPTTTKDNPDNNFCTMNPLSSGVINGAGMPLTNGNTTIYDGDANWRSGFGTIGDNQGKYYFEAKMVGSSTNWWVGFLDARQVVKGEYKFVSKTRGYGVAGGGQKGNSNSEVSWGVTYAQNDIAMCALDLDNGKIYFGKNGTWSESGDPTSGSTGTGAAYSVTTDYIYLPAVGLYDTTAGMSLNFGNGYFGTTAVSSAGTNASNIGTFEYDVPTGYTAVSTLGLME